jgi:ribose transport system substrate-binding protein
MIEATGGTGKVAILLGSSGNNVTTDRNDGFLKGIEGSELEVIAQQTGNFNRQEGQSVTEQFLQSNPDLTAIYAHNDEMALGAIVALKSAGKEPGKDVKVISIDGTRGASRRSWTAPSTASSSPTRASARSPSTPSSRSCPVSRSRRT